MVPSETPRTSARGSNAPAPARAFPPPPSLVSSLGGTATTPTATWSYGVTALPSSTLRCFACGADLGPRIDVRVVPLVHVSGPAWGPGVRVSYRRAGTGFGRARVLSVRDALGGSVVRFSDGRAVVAWNEGRLLRLAVASRRGNRFRRRNVARERDISFALAGGARRPGLLAWSAVGGIAVADLVRGQLEPAEFLAREARSAVAAGVDGGGGAIVASGGWSPSASAVILTVSERAAGQPFGAAHTVRLPEYPGPLYAVRDSRGGAALLWQRSDAQPNAMVPSSVVEGLSHMPRAAFGVARRLSTPGADVTSPPATAVDVAGNTIAAWVERSGKVWRLTVVERRVGADWGQPTSVLTSRRRPHDARVALNDRGQAAVVFGVTRGRRAALLDVRRPSRHGWTAPEPVGSWAGYVSRDHQVGIDTRGTLTVLWSRRPRAGGGLTDIPTVVAGRHP
jgi:hypothetical protein